jgi:DNA-directed RNA polymerase subunit K/omega
MKGCIPRTGGVHKATVIAQIEVAEGKVERQLVPAAVAAPVIIS